METGQSLKVEVVDKSFIHLTKIDFEYLTIKIQHGSYSTLQFHYHTPSEHTLNGFHYDLELHIVHGNQTKKYNRFPPSNQLSVIGLLFKENPTISEDLFDRFIKRSG